MYGKVEDGISRFVQIGLGNLFRMFFLEVFICDCFKLFEVALGMKGSFKCDKSSNSLGPVFTEGFGVRLPR